MWIHPFHTIHFHYIHKFEHLPYMLIFKSSSETEVTNNNTHTTSKPFSKNTTSFPTSITAINMRTSTDNFSSMPSLTSNSSTFVSVFITATLYSSEWIMPRSHKYLPYCSSHSQKLQPEPSRWLKDSHTNKIRTNSKSQISNRHNNSPDGSGTWRNRGRDSLLFWMSTAPRSCSHSLGTRSTGVQAFPCAGFSSRSSTSRPWEESAAFVAAFLTAAFVAAFVAWRN